MRASQLITISTVAVLMGGASLALGQGGGTATPGVSERGQAMSSERGRAVSGERGKALTAERGRVISGERGQALTAERGRAISAERGQALTAERGLAMTGRGPRATDQQGQFRSRPETSGLANAYGSARSADVGLNAQQRMRLHNILSTRTDIPRASNVGAGAIRVNALVPRGVRFAAVPEQVGRSYPRFRRARVFISGDKIVIVNPKTSRIVAVLPA